MSLSLILACLWVLAAALVALLPMRAQFIPGGALLLAALPLLIFIGFQHGAIPVLIVLAAIVSMFRRPLGALARHLVRRA